MFLFRKFAIIFMAVKWSMFVFSSSQRRNVFSLGLIFIFGCMNSLDVLQCQVSCISSTMKSWGRCFILAGIFSIREGVCFGY